MQNDVKRQFDFSASTFSFFTIKQAVFILCHMQTTGMMFFLRVDDPGLPPAFESQEPTQGPLPWNPRSPTQGPLPWNPRSSAQDFYFLTISFFTFLPSVLLSMFVSPVSWPYQHIHLYFPQTLFDQYQYLNSECATRTVAKRSRTRNSPVQPPSEFWLGTGEAEEDRSVAK